MIYLFYGPDIEKSKCAMRECVEVFHSKYTTAHFHELDDDTFSQKECEELMCSKDLFSPQSVVVFRALCENKDAHEFVKKHIKDFAQSDTIFIFFERNVPSATLALFKKNIKEVHYFPLAQKKNKPFNVFGLTDAIGRRDRKNAWVMLQKAYCEGEEAERMLSLVFWQIKNIVLVKNMQEKKEGSLASLKLNPFVLKKTLSFSKNYSHNEACSLSSQLVALYHDVRRGGEDVRSGLERFVLML